MAFSYRENSVWWDKLLIGKTGHIITTMDTPYWYYKLIYNSAGIKQLKRNIFDFCGIKPVSVTAISPIKNSTLSFRQKWLVKIEKLGKENK
jgi:NAD(P)H dehydrogenase (quinone)